MRSVRYRDQELLFGKYSWSDVEANNVNIMVRQIGKMLSEHFENDLADQAEKLAA